MSFPGVFGVVLLLIQAREKGTRLKSHFLLGVEINEKNNGEISDVRWVTEHQAINLFGGENNSKVKLLQEATKILNKIQ